MEIQNLLDRVIHGDCLEVMKQMPSESVDLVVTSPPYNLRNNNGLKQKNSLWTKCNLANGYDGYSDNLSFEEYVKWQKQCMGEMFRLLKPNGAIFYNNKNRIQGGGIGGQKCDYKWSTFKANHCLEKVGWIQF